MNQLGTKGIDATHFSGVHREWVTALPEFRLDHGTVFDKEKVFPFRLREKSGERGAPALAEAGRRRPEDPRRAPGVRRPRLRRLRLHRLRRVPQRLGHRARQRLPHAARPC
ncbi:hypothetical protein H1V43_21045 [Streptomyces sp. PSKA54]|uniref:Uncharacterized protein n=1 Tax=Streptomyces himalayensis subsp. aureolus TaxID=2758039 RepID=A0A7W2D2Z4_9ACTN|nr:hypothetical protein [Streptomyces himalayensis]MBA4863808.1 hypothetical protein [Streptomyces himalayensis subsp. aureolus]